MGDHPLGHGQSDITQPYEGDSFWHHSAFRDAAFLRRVWDNVSFVIRWASILHRRDFRPPKGADRLRRAIIFCVMACRRHFAIGTPHEFLTVFRPTAVSHGSDLL
jgi:hypothetical protein